MFDVESIRKDFPILKQDVHGHPLVYLDNAATMQVPTHVLKAVEKHYSSKNGNVHRGTHFTSNASTSALEAARKHIANFIGAGSEDCIVFTRGTTESLNLVANGMRSSISSNDHIVCTELEHHSNYVPWQQLCMETGAEFNVCKITESGDLDLIALSRLLKNRPKIVALTCCSNVLGTVTPIKTIVSMAHDAGALVVLDGAQIMRHKNIDVKDIGCDFLAFSGHKIMAGTGIGVLFGRIEALEQLQPLMYGGEMVETVSKECTTFAELPLKLEAGTPNYVGSIALDAAISYLENLGINNVARYEEQLIAYAADRLEAIDGLRILGHPHERAGCISFVVRGVHPFDLCTLVDKLGIALRSGHNCAQPVLRALDETSVSRLSPAFYNTFDEIDRAADSIEKCIKLIRSTR